MTRLFAMLALCLLALPAAAYESNEAEVDPLPTIQAKPTTPPEMKAAPGGVYSNNDGEKAEEAAAQTYESGFAPTAERPVSPTAVSPSFSIDPAKVDTAGLTVLTGLDFYKKTVDISGTAIVLFWSPRNENSVKMIPLFAKAMKDPALKDIPHYLTNIDDARPTVARYGIYAFPTIAYMQNRAPRTRAIGLANTEADLKAWLLDARKKYPDTTP
jgi:hypothetical protein